MSGFYDLVVGGVIQDTKFFINDPPLMSATKGAWLHHVEVKPTPQPWQVLVGPEIDVQLTQVVHTWEVQDISQEEIDAIALAKHKQVEAEYRRRVGLPFQAEVDGVVRWWHGDADGMGDLGDVLFGIAFGIIPDERLWKPYDLNYRIPVSKEGFLAMKLSHAFRKELLFDFQTNYKASLEAMREAGDAQGVVMFDPIDWGF